MRKSFRSYGLLLIGFMALVWVGASASTLSGQSYETFSNYYKDNIAFINHNDSRHLIQLSIAKAKSELDDNRIIYSLMGDTLNVTLTTDATGQVIDDCVITLTAPQGLQYGTALYNDFAISGYQSYALLMAMHADPDPARRYALVTDVEAGLAASQDGRYQRQLGVYTLLCTREGQTVELRFEKSHAVEQPLPEEGVIDPAMLDEEDMEGLL